MIDAPKTTQLQTTADPAPRPHVVYLDGIRALAALFVVFHHTWQGPFGRVASIGLLGLLTNWALYGHLAVDVFIVLSGFCLVLPIAQSKYIKGGPRNFYFKRAHRILPPFYFAIALSLFVNFVIHKIGNHSLISPTGVFVNLLLLQDWFPEFNVLGPLWSVALEWKIYFLFPLFVWIWRRFGVGFMLLAATVIGYGATLIFHMLRPEVAMGNTCPWYVLLFAIGMSSGISAVNNTQIMPDVKLRWFLPMSIVCSICVLMKWPITALGEQVLYVPHLPLIDPFIGVSTAAALLLLYRNQSNNSIRILQLPSWRPLAYIGTFAYSIYLVHLPMLWITVGILHKIPVLKSSVPLTALVLFLFVIPFIVAVAYIFYLVCERPFLNKNRITASVVVNSKIKETSVLP